MGRRTVAFTEDSVARAIRAVRKAGIEIRTIRIEPDGAVIINADLREISDTTCEFTAQELADGAAGYL